MVIPKCVEENVNKMIARFDKDGNKQLTWKEVYQTFKAEKVEDPLMSTYAIFEACNKDEDDVVTVDEIRKHKYAELVKTIDEDLRKNLKSALAKFDNNKDGIITREEVLETYKKMGVEKPETQTNIVMELIDSDNDGKLYIAEIRKFLGGLPPSQ